jgi:HSP20 family molecular chaperone IbpA
VDSSSQTRARTVVGRDAPVKGNRFLGDRTVCITAAAVLPAAAPSLQLTTGVLGRFGASFWLHECAARASASRAFGARCAPAGTFASGWPQDAAEDDAGELPALRGGNQMLMRFDPFREIDRMTQETFRPSRMPLDAYRRGDASVVHFDLPGVRPDTIDLTVEQNTLTVTAERTWSPVEGDEVVISERQARSAVN